jgi:hypothetical protein
VIRTSVAHRELPRVVVMHVPAALSEGDGLELVAQLRSKEIQMEQLFQSLSLACLGKT